jgi:hypothetical protein
MVSAYRKLSKKLFISAVVLGLLAACPVARATTITFGTPATSGNAFPFGGGFGSNPSTRYQQVYDADLFPAGPLSITDITFFHTLFPGGAISANTYIFHLSTTAKTVGDLNTAVLTNNIGGDDALFASLALSGDPGTSLAISGTPFTYDPANGNLLLDITTTTPNLAGLSIFFDARNGDFGADSSRAHDYGTGFTGFGLVTQFTFTAAAEPVPEPASIVLMVTGMLGVSGYTWLRRKRVA